MSDNKPLVAARMPTAGMVTTMPSATERARAADANVHRLMEAAKLPEGASFHRDPKHNDGDHFGYTVAAGGRDILVLMSGMPIEQWDLRFHCCYIDGNAWTWKYAPGILRAALSLDGEEDAP